MTDISGITAIITAHNSERYLAGALHSVLQQSSPVQQIIVVDDGSTDKTAEIAREFEGVEVITQDNLGPGAARNAGLASAKEELIAYLDADDRWLPRKTELQLEYLKAHPEAVAVSGGKIWRNENTGEEHSHPYSVRHRNRLKNHIAQINCVGNPSMTLIRKTALIEIGGFDPAVRWGQDWDLWIRLCTLGPIGFVPEDVIIYTWRKDNHSHKEPEARLASFYSVSTRGISLLFPARQITFQRLQAMAGYYGARADLASSGGRSGVAFLLSLAAIGIWPFADLRPKVLRVAHLLLGKRLKHRIKKYLFTRNP